MHTATSNQNPPSTAGVMPHLAVLALANYEPGSAPAVLMKQKGHSLTVPLQSAYCITHLFCVLGCHVEASVNVIVQCRLSLAVLCRFSATAETAHATEVRKYTDKIWHWCLFLVAYCVTAKPVKGDTCIDNCVKAFLPLHPCTVGSTAVQPFHRTQINMLSQCTATVYCNSLLCYYHTC